MNTLSTSNPSSSTAASFDSYADQYYLALNQGLSISGEGKGILAHVGQLVGQSLHAGCGTPQAFKYQGPDATRSRSVYVTDPLIPWRTNQSNINYQALF